MAWKHPKYKHQGFEPVDPDEVNENVRQFTQEDADINEHNFLAIPGSTGPVSKRIIERNTCNLVQEIAYTPYELDQSAGGTEGDYVSFGNYLPGLGDDGVLILNNTSWTTLQDRFFSADDSLLWVFASFQQVSNAYNTCIRGFYGQFMVQYALRVNGTLITETVTDAFDLRDDPRGCDANPGAACFSLEALVPVVAGECQIELVGRCANPARYKKTYVTTRELFCVEMKR